MRQFTLAERLITAVLPALCAMAAVSYLAAVADSIDAIAYAKLESAVPPPASHGELARLNSISRRLRSCGGPKLAVGADDR